MDGRIARQHHNIIHHPLFQNRRTKRTKSVLFTCKSFCVKTYFFMSKDRSSLVCVCVCVGGGGGGGGKLL